MDTALTSAEIFIALVVAIVITVITVPLVLKKNRESAEPPSPCLKNCIDPAKCTIIVCEEPFQPRENTTMGTIVATEEFRLKLDLLILENIRNLRF